MITGVVLARNEEANIVECLQSLHPHVAEILLIDMESSDRTVELARPYVTKTLTHPVVPNFDAARNVAISEARFEWLWFLDADERVPQKTADIVGELLADRGPEIVAITIPFKSYFCGKWIEHCGWWPGYTMPRVLKRGHFRFSEQLHKGVEFTGPEVRLPPDPEAAIEHFSYRSIEQYVEKFNRYTTTEAGYLAQQGQPLDWQSTFRAMVRDWWLYYEKNNGHQDANHGWILSWLAGQYRWFSHAKLLDCHHNEPPGVPTSPTIQPTNVPPNLDAVVELIEDELSVLRSQEPQLPLGIVWRSPIWDPSGYADDSRLFLKSLAGDEREVAAEEIPWSHATCQLPDSDATLLRTLARCKRPGFAAAITNCIPTLCQPDPRASLNILFCGLPSRRTAFRPTGRRSSNVSTKCGCSPRTTNSPSGVPECLPRNSGACPVSLTRSCSRREARRRPCPRHLKTGSSSCRFLTGN